MKIQIAILTICLTLNFSFAEEGIMFTIPDSEISKPAVIVKDTQPIQPQVQEVKVQPIVPITPTLTTMGLDLEKLTTKDSESFEIYAARIALVADSVKSHKSSIDSISKAISSSIPPLTPKGEFEKQAEFDKRKKDWESNRLLKIKSACQSLENRVSQLNKAKKMLEEIQVSLLSSIEIETKPKGVKISIGKEKSGLSPATIEGVISGKVLIELRLENYNPIDTQIILKPATKQSLFFTLTEKNIFTEKDEIDLSKILAKDTNTVTVYLGRIQRIHDRQKQVDVEIKAILADFPNAYPKLIPQRPDETVDQFNARKELWSKEGTKRYNALKYKHKNYRTRLDRAVDVLKDYITQVESKVILETPTSAQLTLGKYDSEKEIFELHVVDSASLTMPFIFNGSVGIPIATAKAMNRSTDAFSIAIQHFNYPFVTDSGNVNLAVSKLDLSHHGKFVVVSGSFTEIPKYVTMAEYPLWKLHADSLIKGTLKSRNLDATYAINWIPPKQKIEDSGDHWGWRGWSRFALFTASAVFGGVAIYENQQGSNEADNAHPTTTAEANSIVKKIDGYDKMRNAMWICSGVSAGLGLVTFAF